MKKEAMQIVLKEKDAGWQKIFVVKQIKDRALYGRYRTTCLENLSIKMNLDNSDKKGSKEKYMAGQVIRMFLTDGNPNGVVERRGRMLG